LLPYQ